MSSSSDPGDRLQPPVRAWRRLALGLLLAFVAVNAVVVGIRGHWLVTDGPWHVTTGIEGPPVYAIWKIMHGYPIYQALDAADCATAPYNFAFYYSYAGLLSVFGVADQQLFTAGRLVSAGFALLGAVATWRVAVRLAGPAGRDTGLRLLGLALCLTAWSGPGLIGWFAVSVRSDIGAMALLMCGLAAYLRARESDSTVWAVAAAAAFFGAWAFKQTAVLTLTGVCLFEIIQGRRWKLLFTMAGLCATAMAAALVIGGPIYLSNILAAPARNPIIASDAAKRFLEAVLPAIPFYGFAVAGTIAWLIRRGADPAAAAHRSVGYAFLLSSAVGLVFMGHVGASRNHYYESMMLATAAGTAGLLGALAAGRVGGLRLTALAAAAGCVFPVAILAVPHMGIGMLHWNLTFGDHASSTARARLADAIRRLPTPVYVSDDDILGQPWVATGGQYPAFVLDPIVYDEAEARGLIPGGGVKGMVQRRQFAAVVAKRGDPILAVARDAGYHPVALPSDAAAAPTMTGGPAVWEAHVRGEQ